jgi:phage tail sheath protein FI
MGLDCSTPVSLGTLAYKRAIDTLANKEEFDINMLLLPGVLNSLHGSVITYANDMAESRGDTFFLFDCVGLVDTVPDAIDSVTGIDSNYSATYYPWMKMYDNDNTRYIWAPPSVFIAAVLAFNDKVSAPWYAPAGLNRGGIPEATQVYTRLTQAERDNLYDGRVNPIVTFISQGIVTWGQKTLQVKASALDRINVRRLLIELKKYIASATKYLVFEQNTIQTRTRFLNIVNPYLDGVQQKQGLYTFKVVMDETNNTPDIIDRNMMVGAIWLQPTKTAEMIKIDFNITPTGAQFGQ